MSFSAPVYTGKPCVRGHVAPRYVSSKRCVVCNRQQSEAWAARNPDATRAHSRRSMAKSVKAKAYNVTHAAERRARARAWEAAHPEARKARQAKRRAAVRGARIGDRKAYTAYVKRARTEPEMACAWCQQPTPPEKRHIDHVIPLARGGADAVENLCISCPGCNQRKWAKMPEEFMATRAAS